MAALCGANCEACTMKTMCKGCEETCGRPFGQQCFIAKYISVGGMEQYQEFKQTLIDEFNALKIPGLPKVDTLVPLSGAYVNLEYPLPNKQTVKLLDDRSIYLGYQLECEYGGDLGRCFGLVAGLDFLLVCEYGEGGSDPEIVLFKRR